MMTPSIFGENLFDNFFDDFFGFPAWGMQNPHKNLYGNHAANMMKTDVQERDDSYEVDIDLPGFKKEELSLELKEGYLTIRAAKELDREEKEKDTGKFVRRERYAGSMSRSFFIGKEVKQEEIHAKYESGVLKLTIPKRDNKPQVEEKKYIAIEG